MKDPSPFCYSMIVSSDHWGLNAVQLCGIMLKIASFEANHCLFLSLPLSLFFAAETVMDTRVATAELGWTAYPNSGVSRSLPTHTRTEYKQFQKFVFKRSLLGGRWLGRMMRIMKHSARTVLQPDR